MTDASADDRELTVQSLIAYLRLAEKAHVQLAARAWQADDGAVFSADLVVNAALQRSIALVEGFVAMVEQDNDVCAVPLLRLQMDTVLRLLAAAQFPSGSKVLEAMLKGTPLNRLKAPNGRALTDKYLCECAAGHFPWLPDAYEKASNTVHLSRPAVLSSIIDHQGDGTFTVAIGSGARRRWSVREKFLTVQLFIKATEAVCAAVDSWIGAKEAAAIGRAAKMRESGDGNSSAT